MSKKIVWIAGGSGLVGNHLAHYMDKSAYQVYILSRKPSNHAGSVQTIQWNTDNQTIDTDILPDHIINLAGAGIADKRWTAERKKVLVSSRVDSARTLLKYLQEKQHKVTSYLGASAVGFYGHRSEEILTEESPPGDEFMSECCVLWEKASEDMAPVTNRICMFRIGIVLSSLGGALPKMLMTRKAGIFNYFGSGRQYYPWIHIRDLVRFIIFALENEKTKGIYNTVSPQQITNKTMMEEIIRFNDWKGLLLPAPAFALKIVLGEMSAVVLNSNRTDTSKIENSGFHFEFTHVGQAVSHIIETGM